MGSDYHKPDRYSAFARNWKLIGITSGKRWRKSSIQDKILWHVLERISRSDNGDAIIRSACYEAGLLDGENLRSDEKSDVACLATIELMCLLSGIHAELFDMDGKSVLRIKECPYSDILAGLCSAETICECHLEGVVHAVDPESEIIRRSRICTGDEYCEFEIE